MPEEPVEPPWPRRFRLWLVGTSVLGWIVCVLALRELDLGAVLEPAFGLVCGLLLLSELRPLFTAGSRDANGLVLSTTLRVRAAAALRPARRRAAAGARHAGRSTCPAARRRGGWSSTSGSTRCPGRQPPAVLALLGHGGEPVGAGRPRAARAAGRGARPRLTYFARQPAAGHARPGPARRPTPPWQLLREDLAYEVADATARCWPCRPLVVPGGRAAAVLPAAAAAAAGRRVQGRLRRARPRAAGA